MSGPQRIRYLLLLVLLAGILARSYRIEAPLSGLHKMRQFDTAAIARNYYEDSMRILYPQVDWRGNSPGYVQSEFPIFPYLTAILYKAFGLHEALGRVLNIGIYAVSGVFLFLLAHQLYDERVALIAVLFYSFTPLSFYFTRDFQGDAMSALGAIAGVYYFLRWNQVNSWLYLLLSAAGTCLAILIKPTSIYLGLPLAFLCFRHFGWTTFRRLDLWAYASICIVPSLLWYRHAAQLWTQYGNSFYIAYLKLGAPHVTDHLWLRLGRNLALRLLLEIATPPGLVLLVIGLLALRSRRSLLLYWWAAGFFISILLWPRGNNGHDYYQLQIVFLTSCWMAVGTSFLWQLSASPKGVGPFTAVFLCALVLAFSGRQVRKMMRITSDDWARQYFDRRINALTPPGARIIFAHERPAYVPVEFLQHRTAQGEYLGVDPIDFYLSHRTGWSIDQDSATPAFLEILRQRGAEYFCTFFPEFFRRNPAFKTALDQNYILLEATPKWAIYQLVPRSRVQSSSGKGSGEDSALIGKPLIPEETP